MVLLVASLIAFLQHEKEEEGSEHLLLDRSGYCHYCSGGSPDHCLAKS